MLMVTLFLLVMCRLATQLQKTMNLFLIALAQQRWIYQQALTLALRCLLIHSLPFTSPASSGSVSAFTLKIVQDSSASGYTITWPATVDWPSATAPTLTATASAVDYFVFITHDGGTTYYGFTAGQALG